MQRKFPVLAFGGVLAAVVYVWIAASPAGATSAGGVSRRIPAADV